VLPPDWEGDESSGAFIDAESNNDRNTLERRRAHHFDTW
jgi:hypothetical protein